MITVWANLDIRLNQARIYFEYLVLFAFARYFGHAAIYLIQNLLFSVIYIVNFH